MKTNDYYILSIKYNPLFDGEKPGKYVDKNGFIKYRLTEDGCIAEIYNPQTDTWSLNY